MMPRWLFISCFPVLLLAAGCGDSGSGGGFGAIGGAFGGGSGGTGGATSFLYVTNGGSNNISGFSINATTGGLVALPAAPFPTDSGPSAIAVSSTRSLIYVANGLANKVTAYGLSADGGLVKVATSTATPNPVSVGTTPSALVISSNGQFLYVATRGSDRVTTFSIGTDGGLTSVASVDEIGSAPDLLALSQDGKFLYAGNSGANEITAFSIAASGVLTKIAAAGANTNPLRTGGTGLQGIAASPTASFLYAAHDSSNTVTTFRMESNGLLTLVPASGGRPNPFLLSGAAPSRVLLSRNGRFVYSANGDGTLTTFTIGGDGLLSLAPTSGGQVNPVPAGSSPVAMTLSPDGQHLYVASGGGRVSAYTMAADTGLLSPLNPLVGSSFPVGASPSSIAAVGSP